MDKLIMISNERENTLVQCLTLSTREIEKWYKKVITADEDVDVYEVKPEELQYYIIDGLVMVDTPKKEEIVRKTISE